MHVASPSEMRIGVVRRNRMHAEVNSTLDVEKHLCSLCMNIHCYNYSKLQVFVLNIDKHS